MVTQIFDKYTLFLLVLTRMSGVILLNPVFGRKNIPNIVKVGLTVMLSVALTVSTPAAAPVISNLFDFIFKGLWQFAIGYAISLIMNMALSTISMAADTIDMQIGIGMAKIYDPGSNLSSAVTGSIFNSFLILIFFASNAHITLFKLLSDTLIAIPVGANIQFSSAAVAVVEIMGSTLTLALKFAMPIIAIEFITEMSLGVLTRAVPHVNVFSVGIQLKLLIGLFVLVMLSPLFGSFCDQLYSTMFTNISGMLKSITTS